LKGEFAAVKRIFIVGIARSGTTLLQSMLASHSQIYSLPETHLFQRTIPHQKFKQLFFSVGLKERSYVKEFLKQVGSEKVYREYSGKNRNIEEWTNYLISLLDSLAEFHKYSIWVEKTPMHLYYANLLIRDNPDNFMIHVIRNPLENIASLYYVSQKYPESFSQQSLYKAVRRYKREIRLSESYLGKKNHIIIHYENLVKKPECQLKHLCQTLNLSWDPAMLSYKDAVNHLVFTNEKWKEQNKKQLQIRNKVNERLKKEQIAYVTSRLKYFKSPLLKEYEKIAHIFN
jgi:hypothetical protein